MANFFNTQYNLSKPSFVLNFKILSQVVPEKSLTENFPIHGIGVKEGKNKKMEKEGKNKNKHLDFLIHNKLCHPRGAYKV